MAEPALERAREVADRLERAIELLRDNAQAREAFRFANQAMASQRVRSELVRRRAAEPDAEVKSAARRAGHARDPQLAAVPAGLRAAVPARA